MSPYFEMIRLYGLDPIREKRRDADRWRQRLPSARPTWLARLGCWLLCRLGGWLICIGQYLQTLFDWHEPLTSQDFSLHSSLRTDRGV